MWINLNVFELGVPMASKKKSDKVLIRNSTVEFLIFAPHTGEQSIEARYENETIWLSQKLMATLLMSTSIPSITT